MFKRKTEREIENLVKRILKEEKIKGKINVKFMKDQEIRYLNWKFRKKDQPTDVLAFPFGEKGILGDLAISLDTAKKNAKRFGLIFAEELKRLVIHGTLHLVGYNHGRFMREKEEKYQTYAEKVY